MGAAGLLALIALPLVWGSCGPGALEAGEKKTADRQTVAEIDDPWLRPGRAHEWTGDLDGMVERGVVRVLTTANRTDVFVDGARKRGIVAASAAALEEMLNKQLGQRDAVDVVVVPVRRDQLLPAFTKGLGDVAIGNLTITPERQEIVDFAPPFVSDVRELVVTAPGADPLATVEDLSGRPVWVRRSSSYHASLQALNRRFASEGREPVDLRGLPRELAPGATVDLQLEIGALPDVGAIADFESALA